MIESGYLEKVLGGSQEVDRARRALHMQIKEGSASSERELRETVRRDLNALRQAARGL